MLKIQQAVVRQLIEHAREETPIEACGYLAERDGVVVALFRLKNVDGSSEHFRFDPAEQFAALRQMRSAGVLMCAVYHSHPATPARPSAEDIRLANDPNLHYVIISLAQAEPDVKAFAKALAQDVALADPEAFTINMSKAKRAGRIFIDYLRNGRGATSVVAYSLRARAGAPVSAPVRWERLAPDVRPDSVTLRGAAARLRSLRSDPWAGYEEARRPLPPAG